MGLYDLLGLAEGDGENSLTKWRVIATASDGTRVQHPDEIEDGDWRFEGDPPTEQQFRYRFGEYLDPNVKYALMPSTSTGPDFERVEWSFTVEPERPQRDTADEVAEIVRREASPTFEDVDDVEAQLVWRVAEEEGAKAALEAVNDVKRSENASDHSFLEEADLGDNGQILKAFLADMSKNYGSVGDVVDDVFGSLMETAAGHARVGPTAQLEGGSGQQEAQQQAQEPAEPAARPAPRSPAEEAFKTAAKDDDMAPEQRLDLGHEPDEATRSEMERELTGDDDQAGGADRDGAGDGPPADVDPGNMSAAPAADGGESAAADDDPDDAQEADA